MKILLVPSIEEATSDATRLLVTRLSVAGIEVCVQQPQDNEISVSDISEISLVVAIGGDGTFLRAAHLISFEPIPILGFNHGTLGFLSGKNTRDEFECILDALSGDMPIEHRATLDALIVDEDDNEKHITALNELAYTRGANGHIINYKYSVNGTPIANLRADGLVVATGTGSTGYALSAGGPIVSPDYHGLVVVPVAAHALNSRALMLSPSDVLEIKTFGRGVYESSLFVDGQPLDFHGAMNITVTRGEKELSIVCAGGGFFENVSRVFFAGGGQDDD